MILNKYKKHNVHFILVLLYSLTIRSGFSQINDGGTTVSDEDPERSFIIEPRPPGRNTGNNHKPMFVDCAKYSNTEIEEEQHTGLDVVTVHAVDEDDKESGGIVTYSIIQREGVRSQFRINNATGEITTATFFDRDEPSRQKEVYLTVRANDNGWPVLADICTFKITIKDINDNPPQLDKLKNEASVSEDLKIDREVMRVFAYDIDDRENARLTYALKSSGEFEKYFAIDNRTGVISLKTALNGKRGVTFSSQVIVNDNPINIAERKQNVGDIKITVVGSDKQLPTFVEYPKDPIYVKENFSDFEEPFAIITAQSNIKSINLRFELIRGHTTQTNKDSTFKLTPLNETSAKITLGRALDYETVTEYQLTVRVENKDSLAAAITIDFKIEDVNDEIPDFVDIVTGSVLENEEPGAEVMQVRAIDKDGTSAHNIVSYTLNSHETLFSVDSETGKVVTRVKFDREAQDVYNIEIIARDNSPSALRRTSTDPNSSTQTFRVTIEDKNDNKPEFSQSTYRVDNLSENIDIGHLVIEVRANDMDSASVIRYSITSGNEEGAFKIEESTGRIRVNATLDYETTTTYNLTITAHDGVFSDEAKVFIFIDNINDELPIFEPYNRNITGILEETVYTDCIITLEAWDPDIRNREDPQHIVYQVDEKYRHFLEVDENGCVKLTKPLDRDKPDGSPSYQAFIIAYDDNNGPNAQQQSAEIFIILDDINDNAPFLTTTTVVWNEHQEPGKITTLEADDYDSPENGPPFIFAFADGVGEDIKLGFEIRGDELFALVEFDREKQKFYDLLINITDSGIPPQSGGSLLRVIIGDINDNPAGDGKSEIFVYNYESSAPDVQIGRVFVEDLDDWDLPDKVFQWATGPHEFFNLNSDNGTLTMLHGTPANEYILEFKVTEESALIERHTVSAIVNVTVRDIPREAVVKSGSMRLSMMDAETFVARIHGVSPKDVLHEQLLQILNVTRDNIDIFTVLSNSYSDSVFDVRFSAHGSPYYAAERLNSKVSLHVSQLESKVGVRIDMISISECFLENVCDAGSSCSDHLDISEVPATVFTNRTSFVGVNAVIRPVCDCRPFDVYERCHNGGTYIEEKNTCICAPEYEGPNCEALAIGFKGNGWAMYPSFEACNATRITLEVTADEDDGLIFYVGPMSLHPNPLVTDFMSLELKGGFPVIYLNYGSDTREISLRTKKLTDGSSHTISISMKSTEVSISVDDCHRSDCVTYGHPPGSNGLLNVNGPLQVGGTREDMHQVAEFLKWNHIPSPKGFVGCIRNFTYNEQLYNLGVPGEQLNAISNCNWGIAKAVTFGIDSNFLVAILVCVAILLILLLAVVVHRRKENNWNEKDADDICENIISYQDEGGGEVDTGFDMSVLKMHDKDLTSDPPINENLYKQAPDAPDISAFLNPKKDNCDRDPNSYPFDDVRYYAYEGDGNSTGSLSSLASCKLTFISLWNYLFTFEER
ncbi:Cadherin [Oryctes borbonicus]|uniref:Cadherin n=1 Tax=Oryctes borbonicus TaxID=1629725 RepID=A0A0T6B8M6_9SCAR|nr:Cadherin [Oryctes borbonicus]